MDRGIQNHQNHQIKNTPSIVESFKSIKKNDNFPKSENFEGFDDFGGR